MNFTENFTPGGNPWRFALIGTPVGHSLSPVMHNKLYKSADINWKYEAVDCPDEETALHQLDLIRTGYFRGMNITMPYKRLAMEYADVVDASALAAGGANVLVRGMDYTVHAYNTDGLGAVDAIEREGGLSVSGTYAAVCGTGPTACAIACALVQKGAAEVSIFSREEQRARNAARGIISSLGMKAAKVLKPCSYEDAWRIIPGRRVVVDATPRGMNPDDEPIIETSLFNSGQVVLDVVYGHGVTKLVAGAREQGATALDGVEMLVGQAALAVEIWQEKLYVHFDIDRSIMRAVCKRA